MINTHSHSNTTSKYNSCVQLCVRVCVFALILWKLEGFFLLIFNLIGLLFGCDNISNYPHVIFDFLFGAPFSKCLRCAYGKWQIKWNIATIIYLSTVCPFHFRFVYLILCVCVYEYFFLLEHQLNTRIIRQWTSKQEQKQEVSHYQLLYILSLSLPLRLPKSPIVTKIILPHSIRSDFSLELLLRIRNFPPGHESHVT